MQKTLVRQVRDANRRVFDSKDFDEYEENPSIFEASRQDEIERILHDTVANRDRILDVAEKFAQQGNQNAPNALY